MFKLQLEHYWASVNNRKAVLLEFAARHQFDPLVPKNWYSAPLNEIYEVISSFLFLFPFFLYSLSSSFSCRSLALSSLLLSSDLYQFLLKTLNQCLISMEEIPIMGLFPKLDCLPSFFQSLSFPSLFHSLLSLLLSSLTYIYST